MGVCITNCGNPVEDAALCNGCWGQVDAALRSISWLAEELQVTITRQSVGSKGPKTASAPDETPILFNVAARERQDDLRTVLVGWVRCLWEWRGADRLDCEDTLEGMAAWLLRHPTWCRQHPAADELWDEIRDAVERCVQVIDRAPDRIYLSLCDADLDDGTVCAARLYGREDRSTATCRECGTRWDVTERRGWMVARAAHEEVNSVKLSDLLAALGYAVPSSTIRTWARAGKLERRGKDERGRPTYLVGDVLELAFPQNREQSAA
ncbi:hypothetical protein LCD36_04555 [Saccharopolyspora sp. 6T]|uniref:hypothetical protein n=1 Tax=Saccharopolyspora sp. 6T TaxID=2877238 RepID=UPI001CD39E5B|nr:hypothetical protein [Saccharopolyspora sp. 6T]MCA1185723.1 hypothetical protein [Saccharopolyspora sp. 6T]